MRSFFENKTWVLLASILALGALTVLSVSLREVDFNEAQPIGRSDAEPFPLLNRVPVTQEQGDFWSQILPWMVLVLLIALVAMLLSPEGRKKLFRMLVRGGAIYLAVYFLLKNYPEIFSNLLLDLAAPSADGQAEHLAEIPPPVFTPPQPTAFVSYTTSVLIVLALMYFAWRLYRTWTELNPPARQGPLSEIARIARSSLRDLSSGRESTDVILHCYFRMSDAVADKKNMRRESSMTPAEFAMRLERSGLPGDAVQRLTRLFEGVRYGSQKTGPKEINEAVACLTTILQYCGEPV